MGAFSFREDIKKVQWGRTVGLNLLRACSAGVVWGALLLIGGGLRSDGPPWFTLPLVLPLAYLVMLPCYLIAARIVTMAAGGLGEFGVGIGTILLSFFLAVGDPFVFILHKLKPGMVPAERFSFVNLALVLFVLDPAKL